MSAAAGLNFFAGDFDGIAIPDGGNGMVAEALLQNLYKEVGKDRLRPSSLVFDIQVVKDGVLISYLMPDQKIKTVHSKYVIVSCPKFVVKKIIPDLEPQRLEAIQAIQYRAYLVGNLLLRQKVKPSFYDLLFFENSKEKETDVRARAKAQKITDLIYGNGSKINNPQTVLTLYRALPYEGGRTEVYSPDAFETIRKEFEDQINSTVLPMLGISRKNIVDLRIARWGHAMPLSSVGNIATKTDWLRKPFRDRVYFAEQDNWTLPSFETGFNEALACTSEVRKKLAP